MTYNFPIFSTKQSNSPGYHTKHTIIICYKLQTINNDFATALYRLTVQVHVVIDSVLFSGLISTQANNKLTVFDSKGIENTSLHGL